MGSVPGLKVDKVLDRAYDGLTEDDLAVTGYYMLHMMSAIQISEL